MSKKNARKKKTRSRTRRTRAVGNGEIDTSGSPRSAVKTLIRAASVIVTLLGLLSVLDYLPRLTVECCDPLDPRNPLTTIFRLTNEGIFPVNKIRYKFAMLHLLSSGNGLDVSMHGRTVFVTDGQTIPSLSRDEKRSLVCPSGFSLLTQDTRQCEIEILVEYHLFMLPITKEQRYRFEATMDSSQHWRWKEKAVSEPY